MSNLYDVIPLPCHWVLSDKFAWIHHWRIQGAPPVCAPLPNRINFFHFRGGSRIVTGLKLPFWGLSFVEFWCWGLIFGGQGGPGHRGPPWIRPCIFACVFTEKCTRRRLAPPPPNGKSWIRHCTLYIDGILVSVILFIDVCPVSTDVIVTHLVT